MSRPPGGGSALPVVRVRGPIRLTNMPEEAKFEWVKKLPSLVVQSLDWVHYLLPKPGTLSER